MWVTINANAYPTRSKFSEGRSATLATGMALALVSEMSTWNILRQVIAYWLSSVPYVFVHDLPLASFGDPRNRSHPRTYGFHGLLMAPNLGCPAFRPLMGSLRLGGLFAIRWTHHTRFRRQQPAQLCVDCAQMTVSIHAVYQNSCAIGKLFEQPVKYVAHCKMSPPWRTSRTDFRLR